MMEIMAIGSEGSGALQYLRPDLIHRPAIYTYMPAHWAPPITRGHSLTVTPLIMVSSTTRHLTLLEQRVLHAALRRTAKPFRPTVSRT
jgi:hypothetical protein